VLAEAQLQAPRSLACLPGADTLRDCANAARPARLSDVLMVWSIGRMGRSTATVAAALAELEAARRVRA
jgi:hypothetical protein